MFIDSNEKYKKNSLAFQSKYLIPFHQRLFLFEIYYALGIVLHVNIKIVFSLNFFFCL